MAKNHDSVNLKTPKGGEDCYIFLIVHKDKILGSLIFNDKEAYEEFKNNYESLPADNGWGSILLGIDTK